MYRVNDYVVYGKKGVCRVTAVGTPPFAAYTGDRQYYTLNPLGTNETIYIPVDTDRFMRPVMSREEALSLLERIPQIEDCLREADGINSKELPHYYGKLMQTHRCEDLLRLLLTTYVRRQRALSQRRKVCQADQDFFREAENILCGELMLALGMERQQVLEYVMERIRAREEAPEHRTEE